MLSVWTAICLGKLTCSTAASGGGGDRPADAEGDEVVYIEPETPVAFAIWLRKQREALGLSHSDVAKKLSIK